MNRLSWTAVMVIFASVVTLAQQESGHQRTSVPPDSRYEVAQSPLAAQSTFLLDKHTGVVRLLVRLENDAFVWEVMPLLDDAGRRPGQVNYQMFFSGLAARFTYVVNIHTGSVWQLVRDSNGRLSWEPMMKEAVTTQ